MNLTPQVDMAELSDADLENVSGGMAGGASAGLAGSLSGVVGPLAGEVCGNLQAALSPEGGAGSGSLNVQTTSL
ncbi:MULTISPECIES: hypothetical protein [unclassified Streptomyces]|uniref:hypothetical protein n=1 Tax=unclassified Streptomyces TaxID=2593676 RepID=UPI0004BF0798|nr:MULTISPECIES: hypothetical protein [unclassified Streptomyces]